jgi:two-component system, NarL family, nitrate/nitrite response regulator NarL
MSIVDVLTEREKEVLKHICEGKRDLEIAKSLYVSVNTVKMHVRHILAKYKLRDRKQLIVFITNREI